MKRMKLFHKNPDNRLRAIEVFPDDKKYHFLLGRHTDNDEVIEEPTISRYHGMIFRSGDEFYLLAYAANGIYYNGRKEDFSDSSTKVTSVAVDQRFRLSDKSRHAYRTSVTLVGNIPGYVKGKFSRVEHLQYYIDLTKTEEGRQLLVSLARQLQHNGWIGLGWRGRIGSYFVSIFEETRAIYR